MRRPEADDRKRVYDIEMQAYNKDDIRKRSRYHQAMVDTELLDKGTLFSDLNESYVIFICTSDLFGKGRHKYTFRNRCDEDPGILLDDKAIKVFLNADGALDDVSPELEAFLKLVTGASSEDPFVKEMEKAIERIKLDKEARRSYMTWEMEMKYREHIALQEGIEQGIGETLDVLERLLDGATKEELLSEGKDSSVIDRCIKRLAERKSGAESANLSA